ncbi:uncharacterized protein LOC143879392 isoform X2 [Tasmannia lanceolata]|uniref:uncharacterized protein LOC143879392 isoform X2 n=1 Tax=Tasmannia lanceolata TaxID=3420 RepID=UPI004062C102
MASGLSESASKTPRQRSSCLGCTNGSIFMYIHKNARSVKQYSSLTLTQNVRFLANFLTESGIIIKRSQTCISAKAQRKVGRMIKIARAFGLMPFTMMVTIQLWKILMRITSLMIMITLVFQFIPTQRRTPF